MTYEIGALLALLSSLMVGVALFLMWRQKRNPSLDSLDRLDFYHPGERLIYSYFDGNEERKVDPVVVYKRYMQHLPDLKHHSALARSQHSQAHKGQEMLLEKVRLIFDVKEFDGVKGLTELETMWLFDHFLIYNESVKKNWNPSATSPEGPSPTSPPSRAENPPTPSSTATGSSGNEPSSGKPPPSPLGSPSPTEPTPG